MPNVDHGKSTLADRLIEICQGIEKRDMQATTLGMKESDIYGGKACHGLGLSYHGMMGNVAASTGWVVQGSTLGMGKVSVEGASVGAFGAVHYDYGSFSGVRPYVGLVTSWHTMLSPPSGISGIFAHEVHGVVGVQFSTGAMNMLVEGRCGQHGQETAYKNSSVSFATSSCAANIKASYSF